MSSFEEHLPLAERAATYLTSSPDPYHAVSNGLSMLQDAGYSLLNDREPFNAKLVPGGKYCYEVDGTTLVAFCVGRKYEPGNGFKIIGGHTDSPNLRVKPKSKRGGNGGGPSGCVQLGVETYGGGLWHTWFDRDLGVSGRVLVREQDASSSSAGRGKIVKKLVKIDRPIARISSLAIHLQTPEERKAFAVNKEDHLNPILATTALVDGAKEQLTGNGNGGEAVGSEEEDVWSEGHEPLLLHLLASELKISKNRIADFDLNLFDVQPASVGGIRGKEFLHSARLDNLATCFVALEGLVAHSTSGLLEEDGDVSLVALFDHEEVGSESSRGAGSPVVVDAVRRISSALSPDRRNDPDTIASTTKRSFVLSVDMAHAVHPNYASKHESSHGPKLNGGTVIKTNSNQRYATDSITGFVVRELARRCSLHPPIQEFVVRNDCGCGTTIGPILASETGMRTVDIGMPQLSMHSVREVMGIADLTHCLELFKGFFARFREIDDDLEG